MIWIIALVLQALFAGSNSHGVTPIPVADYVEPRTYAQTEEEKWQLFWERAYYDAYIEICEYLGDDTRMNAAADASAEFTELFESYETKRASTGRLLIRSGNSGSYKFAKSN